MIPPLGPIMLKDRISMIFLRYGHLDVIDGAFVLVDQNGVRTHIPVGSVACIMLEPGTRVSHAAVKLASVVGTLLVFVCIHPVNREVPDLINCCIKRAWLWIRNLGSGLFKECTSYALRNGLIKIYPSNN